MILPLGFGRYFLLGFFDFSISATPKKFDSDHCAKNEKHHRVKKDLAHAASSAFSFRAAALALTHAMISAFVQRTTRGER